MRVLGTALYKGTDNLGDSAKDQLLENQHFKFSRPTLSQEKEAGRSIGHAVAVNTRTSTFLSLARSRLD